MRVQFYQSTKSLKEMNNIRQMWLRNLLGQYYQKLYLSSQESKPSTSIPCCLSKILFHPLYPNQDTFTTHIYSSCLLILLQHIDFAWKVKYESLLWLLIGKMAIGDWPFWRIFEKFYCNCQILVAWSPSHTYCPLEKPLLQFHHQHKPCHQLYDHKDMITGISHRDPMDEKWAELNRIPKW